MTIVTVHGTFARNWLIRNFFGGRGWWRANSYFHQALRGKIPDCALVEFAWSGRNSHAARISAGEKLAEFVTRLRRNAPQEDIAVIGHSHGGNVALKAVDLAEPKTISAVFLLGTPHLSIICKKPAACDERFEGARNPCGGTTEHWLYWGDAANRVGKGIWGFYSPYDPVQVPIAGSFPGLSFSMRSRLPGRLLARRHFLPPDKAGITNTVLDMKARERVGFFGRLVRWDGIKEHNALHSAAVAEMIGNILAGGGS